MIFNQKSWVGFDIGYLDEQKNIPGNIIPSIKYGIFHPSDLLKNKPSFDALQRINILYARNYKVGTDIRILSKKLFSLGNKNL